MRGRTPSVQPSPKLVLCVNLAVGLVLVLLAVIIRLFLSNHVGFAVVEKPALALGLILLLLATLPARPTRARVLLGFCVSVAFFLLSIAAAEITFRWIGFDFRRQAAARRSIAPYYRSPMTPSGKVYFRRSGPQEWTGQVLRTWVTQAGYSDAPYRDEPVVTVRYDALGYRNEERMDDWEIAVAGDSFTELGHLRHEDLWTTILARRTGSRILNLGVAQTGPLAQLSYLEDYGVSKSLKLTMIVFFEGNDIGDLASEYRALLAYEATGQRPFRLIDKQTSLMTAFGEHLLDWAGTERRRAYPQLQTRLWQSGRGDVPVTLGQMAPATADLGPGNLAALERFYRDYRSFGLSHSVEISLAYMPCKWRVLHSRLRPTAAGGTSDPSWSPTDLPGLIADGCRRYGIGFIDLTPALLQETERTGALVFNGMVDTHLNVRGSAVVGLELARWLRDEPQHPQERKPESRVPPAG